MKPVLSLIVLGFRNFDAVTKNCLESLIPWANNPAIEIWVLDNGSPDDSALKTQAWCDAHPGFRCLLSDTNRGFAGGMNWGASHATGDWLLLVNNDTVFPKLALDAMLTVVQEAPSKVAMLGPVTNAAGNGQRLWKPDADHAQWLEIGYTLHQNPTHLLMPAYRCDFFCIAIKRAVWNELGGLDTVFGLGYYEDFDFSLRLRKAGYEQKITEDVFVLHAGSATFKGNKEARLLIKKNKNILKNKHPSALFQHTRIGNLDVIKNYIPMLRNNSLNKEIKIRLDLRVGALKGDAPKSFLKRLVWSYKVGKIYEEI